MRPTGSVAEQVLNSADVARLVTFTSLALCATITLTYLSLLTWLVVFPSKRQVSNMVWARSIAKELLKIACVASLASPAVLILFGRSLIVWLVSQAKQVITRSRHSASAASRLLEAVDALESYAVDEILRTDIPSMEVVSKGETQDLHSLIKAKFLECPQDHPFHQELKTILAIREQLPVIRIGDTIVGRHQGVGFVTNDFQQDLANRHAGKTDALTRQGKTCLNTYKESEQNRARTLMGTASTEREWSGQLRPVLRRYVSSSATVLASPDLHHQIQPWLHAVLTSFFVAFAWRTVRVTTTGDDIWAPYGAP